MKLASPRDSNKPKSLTAQIKDAERRLFDRQRRVGVCTATLAENIRHQMAAPANLLLAAGIGFIIGELTTHPKKSSSATGKPRVAGRSPLRSALNLITSVHTLYTALPLAWLMKSYRQPVAGRQMPERKKFSTTAAFGKRRKPR